MLAALMLGCGGPQLAPYEPLVQETKLSGDRLWSESENTLLDRGYLIAQKKSKQRQLITEPRTLLGSHVAHHRFRYAWTLRIQGSRVHLELSCAEGGESGQLRDCGEEVPVRLIREQQLILQHLLHAAKEPPSE